MKTRIDYGILQKGKIVTTYFEYDSIIAGVELVVQRTKEMEWFRELPNLVPNSQNPHSPETDRS